MRNGRCMGEAATPSTPAGSSSVMAFRRCGPPGALHILGMTTVLAILVALGLLATLGTLFAGMLGLVRDDGAGRSNALMRWRVVLQGATLVLFALLLMLTRS